MELEYGWNAEPTRSPATQRAFVSSVLFHGGPPRKPMSQSYAAPPMASGLSLGSSTQRTPLAQMACLRSTR